MSVSSLGHLLFDDASAEDLQDRCQADRLRVFNVFVVDAGAVVVGRVGAGRGDGGLALSLLAQGGLGGGAAPLPYL